MVQVKICGICDLASAQAAVDAGADLLGFHFCDSSRRIAPEEARSIVEAIDPRPAIVGVLRVTITVSMAGLFWTAPW